MESRISNVQEPRTDLYTNGYWTKHEATPTTPTAVQRSRRARAGPWERTSPVLVSLLSVILCSVLVILHWTHIAFDGHSSLYLFTTHHRATVQVVVNILASILGFIQTFAVFKAFNMTTRQTFAGKELTLNSLRFYVAISKNTWDLNLPLGLLIASAFVCLIAVLPTWFWTGALTPQIVTISQDASIWNIKTGQGSYPFLYVPNTNVISEGCLRETLQNGTFTNCPAREHSGSIINDMGTASTFGGMARNHSKLDNSGYNSVNRSFGAGASVGLFSMPLDGIVEGYTFSELGYLTNANCTYNTSSKWKLNDSYSDFGCCSGVPNIFYAEGQLPNQGGSASYAQVQLGDVPDQVVAIAAGSYSSGDTMWYNGTAPFYVAIAAGHEYNILDKVQCELSFQPTVFDVDVSLLFGQAYKVSPRYNSGDEADPEPRGVLREWALRSLQSLSMIESTLYVSSLGEAFASNIVNKLNATNSDLTEIKKYHTDKALPAIEASIEAAMDDILQNLNGYSLTQPGGFEKQNATFRLSVVQIGSSPFLIASFVSNAVILLSICIIASFTRMFTTSPAFDFADLGSVAAAVSNGGAVSGYNARKVVDWDGEPRDIGKVTFSLDVSLDSTLAPFARFE